MTSRTPRRHRRLALLAVGTAAAMVLVPGTALAEETPTPLDRVVETLKDVAGSVGTPAAPVVPGVPGVPDLKVPALPAPLPKVPGVPLPLDSDSDSPGHETADPQFPDHGSGWVGDVNLNKQDIADLTRYDATVNDDGSTRSDATVLGLFGNEVVGSSASSAGVTEAGSNPTAGLCSGTGGALCLGLLYNDTVALVDEDGSIAGARGGLLSLCLLGQDPNVTTTYECKGLLGAGAAEGEGVAERDGKTGHTTAYSDNELLKLCLTKGWDNFTCQGLLGVSVLHSDSESESVTPNTSRASWLIGLDSGGNSVFRLDQPTSLAVLPDCGQVAILCLFLNQGESFIFENPQGAGSAQEALHLDLLNNTPLDILVELGKAESIAHLESPEGCPPGQKGPCPPADKPECKDGIDNDKDGKIDFPADPECESPEDDSEADGKKDGKKDGLAKTGADVAPLLAGAFLLIGLGALTVAVTRRRVGKHTV